MKKIIISTLLSAFALFLVFSSVNAQGVVLPTDSGLPNPPGGIAAVIANFTKWLLGIFGFIAIISFVITGIMYFLAAGDEAAQEKAKKQMTWSILGVVVGLIGVVIVFAVDALLNGSTNF